MAPHRSLAAAAAAATAALLCLAGPGAQAHPCESEHFEFCPESGPDTLGACLAGVDGAKKSEPCGAWLATHDACAAELKDGCARACAGEPCAYRDDAVQC